MQKIIIDTPDKQTSPCHGQVLWITGLSGAGKSTLASEMARRLRASGKAVVVLDGDELRDVFGAVLASKENHGRTARLALAMRYAHLCQVVARQGLTVIIATISLFKEVHAWNRCHLPGYLEVYLKVPLDELRRRDPKGIYRRFDSGQLQHVAGLDLTVDEPESPDCVLEFSPELSVEAAADRLMSIMNLRDTQ